MLSLTGSDLEAFGQNVFAEMGFTCIHPLAAARLADIDPEGKYRGDAQVEFSYLIPSGKLCLFGKITAEKSPEALRKIYYLFTRHFEIVINAIRR